MPNFKPKRTDNSPSKNTGIIKSSEDRKPFCYNYYQKPNGMDTNITLDSPRSRHSGATLQRVFIEQNLCKRIANTGQEHEENEENEEDSFFVADMGEVNRQYVRWRRLLPRVKPFYAVKCNPNKEVLKLLALLGTGFDCSSRGEIEEVLNLGVEPSRILYANPSKARSHIRYAKRQGVCKMTFDGADELHKIKSIFPEAELILRIMADDSSSTCRFSHKFGAPLSATHALLKMASELGLNVVGVSFHIGSGAVDPALFVQAIRDSWIVFEQAKELNYSLKILDIGGGFSTESFQDMSKSVTFAVDEYFPGDFDIIAEPGRYFVASAFTLASNVIARREIWGKDDKSGYMLTLSDGVYGSFMDCLLSHWRPEPHILCSKIQEDTSSPIKYSIWGPTCDGVDQITEDFFFSGLLTTGDWLYFEGMGAYSLCLASTFNGFSSQRMVHYVSSEPATSALLQY